MALRPAWGEIGDPGSASDAPDSGELRRAQGTRAGVRRRGTGADAGSGRAWPVAVRAVRRPLGLVALRLWGVEWRRPSRVPRYRCFVQAVVRF
ncbi:hypothetical protein NDU88_001299 [Pleurodeles waltl]|uniref:Uncharacterized protein n=1 Tax=Pleurodeles waltl TaxID=8319 RepID=A0AAV7L9B0_PLEWA|nr:hypothetical protein NDU88_001299 [Pleurodeles waltl]